MARYSRAKDFHRLLTNLDSFTAGQASILDFDNDSLALITILLMPKDGLYAGGKYVFEVIVIYLFLLYCYYFNN